MTSKTTHRFIYGVRVVTTEVETAQGVIRTDNGLLEAMERPYQNLTTQEALQRINKKYQDILRDNQELVARFVS